MLELIELNPAFGHNLASGLASGHNLDSGLAFSHNCSLSSLALLALFA